MKKLKDRKDSSLLVTIRWRFHPHLFSMPEISTKWQQLRNYGKMVRGMKWIHLIRFNSRKNVVSVLFCCCCQASCFCSRYDRQINCKSCQYFHNFMDLNTLWWTYGWKYVFFPRTSTCGYKTSQFIMVRSSLPVAAVYYENDTRWEPNFNLPWGGWRQQQWNTVQWQWVCLLKTSLLGRRRYYGLTFRSAKPLCLVVFGYRR